MDEGVLTLLVLAGVGAVLAAEVMWVFVVLPMRERELRAVAASEAAAREMGAMRKRFGHEIDAAAQNARAAWREVRTLAGHVDEVVRHADDLREQRDDAREHAMWAEIQIDIEREQAAKNVALVLTYYGREIERREAVEVELERERVVSAGMERLIGGGS